MRALLSNGTMGIEVPIARIGRRDVRVLVVATVEGKPCAAAGNGEVDAACLRGDLGVLGAGVFALEPDDGVAGAGGLADIEGCVDGAEGREGEGDGVDEHG